MLYRVTFVCTGNICRSPMAEAIFRHHAERAGLEVEVDSSGTGAWHVGEPADPPAARTLREAGYECVHTARRFEPDWFDRYDLILGIDTGHRRILRRLAPTDEAREKVRLLREFDPAAGDDLDVPDPWGGGDLGFELVREQIEAAIPALLDHVRRELKDG